MKKAFIIIALLAYSLSSFATELVPFSIYISKIAESKKLVLNFDNMLAATVVCKIIDQNGSVIYTEKLNTLQQKSRRYDLSGLKSGDYTISIDDLMKVEELALTVTAADVALNENVSVTTFKPVVWIKENRTVDFNLLALGNDVNVKILAENGTEVYNEDFSDKTTIGKVYDFKKSPKGMYTMQVSVNGKTFYKYLTI
jgi:flagellar hook assembly protein FlgD